MTALECQLDRVPAVIGAVAGYTGDSQDSPTPSTPIDPVHLIRLPAQGRKGLEQDVVRIGWATFHPVFLGLFLGAPDRNPRNFVVLDRCFVEFTQDFGILKNLHEGLGKLYRRL